MVDDTEYIDRQTGFSEAKQKKRLDWGRAAQSPEAGPSGYGRTDPPSPELSGSEFPVTISPQCLRISEVATGGIVLRSLLQDRDRPCQMKGGMIDTCLVVLSTPAATRIRRE